MTDGVVQVAPNSTGAKIDMSELTVSAQTVERQRVIISSDATAAGLADVTNAPPASTAYGLPVRPVGDLQVGLSAASITATGVLGTWETTGYQSFNLQVSGTFSATVAIEESNDNTNWFSVYFFNTTSSQPSTASNGFTGSIPHGYGIIKARYIRLRCSAFTSNTSSAVTFVLRAAALPIENVNVGTVTTMPTVTVTPSNTAPTSTTGTTAFVKSAATTNATSVKASAGNLLGMFLSNNSAATKYVKFYNKASAPTVGTDTPVFVLAIPAAGSIDVDGNAWAYPRFSTGIAYAITGAATDADTTAVAVNDVSGFIVYA